MKDALIIVAFLAVWFAASKYVLPKMGVPT